MTKYQPADVVLVPFPFTDLSILKKRPALVLATIRPKKLPPLHIIAMITSRIDSEVIDGDLVLKGWQKYGLLYQSKVRLAKVVSIEENIVDGKLGSVSSSEWKKIKQTFLKLFTR